MASIKRHHESGCAGGTCNCPWTLDYRPQGMAGARRRLLFPTKKAAERHQAETVVKVSRREYVPPAAIPAFAAVAQEWIADKAGPLGTGRHPATLAGWRSMLRHLAPLDDLRLDRIDVAMIEKLRDDLGKRTKQTPGGLGSKRIRDIMTTCAAVFKLAMRRNYVTRNPAAEAQRPGKPVVEVKDAGEQTGSLRPDEVLDASEIKKLLDHATPGLWRTMFATAAATGMRSEELGGLQWPDVELDAARLFVKRSLSWTRDHGEVGKVKPRFYPPKTKAGYRELPLQPELVAMLRTWKLQCPPGQHDLVFPGAGGLPLRRSHVLRAGLYPACRRAGLRRANIKTLRHSFASGLLAQGAPITMVQALMGHANAGVTLKVYSHWLPREDNGAAGRYAASFLGAAPARVRAAS